jgi:hypothetical protein
VVLRFGRARRRYERQGVLVEDIVPPADVPPGDEVYATATNAVGTSATTPADQFAWECRS